jgi:hypothetical protein
MENKKEYKLKKDDLRKMISFAKQESVDKIEIKFKSQDTINK